MNQQDARVIAAVGVNALHGKRATSSLFRAPESDMPDERYIAERTAMLVRRIDAVRWGPAVSRQGGRAQVTPFAGGTVGLRATMR